MEVGSLFILLLIAALGVTWLALPFLRRAGTVAVHAQAERSALVNDYARVVASLRDLEEDHSTGKLNDAQYDAEKARLSAQGVSLLEALDQQGLLPELKRATETTQGGLPGTPGAAEDALDEALEAAIARYASAHGKG